MNERHNAGRTPHRIRTRAAITPALQWEVFQTLLGFAFTVQQEAQKLTQPAISRLSNSLDTDLLAAGVHPALHRIAACARNLTESSGAAIALGNGDAMVCVARSGETAPVVGAQFDAFSGLSGECIRTGEAVICVNAAADPRVNYQACRAMDIASMLYLPLFSSRGKLMGILGVFAAQPLHFSKRDLTCLQFTEALVQEALNRSAAEPEPDALSGILRRAQELDAKSKNSGNELEDLISEFNLQAAPQIPARTALPKPVEISDLVPKPALPASVTAPRAEVKPAVTATERTVEPTFVGRIVDESVREPEAYEVPSPSRLPLIVAAVVLVAIAMAGLNYHKIYAMFRPAHATPTATAEAPAKPPEPVMPPVTTPPVSLTSDLSISSNESSAIVTVALAQPVTFEGGTLPNPDRVYIDLRGLKLTDASRTNFQIDSGLVSRIRVAGYSAVSTRIVFDLRHPAKFTTKILENPKRLVITLLASDAAAIPAAQPVVPAAAKLTVVIDPGHGGRDTGTIGIDGLREKDVTLDIGKRLGLLLRERLGATVVFTRVDDSSVPLTSRVATANEANADFLISIHGNSSSFDNIQGVETYYFQNSQEALATASDSGHHMPTASADPGNAKAFAADVQSALLHGLAEDKEPMRDRGVRNGAFVVLREARMPAVLAEVSFMSTRKDAKRLESALYREQVASALYQGIARHVSRRDTKTAIADLDNGHRIGTP